MIKIKRKNKTASNQKNLRIENLQQAEHICNMGLAFHKRGQIDEAIKYYLKSIELNPNYADSYINLGSIMQERGQLDEAIKNYEKALQLRPQDATANYNLGSVFQKIGQLEKALNYYDKALKINPNLFVAYNNLGSALQEKGQLDEALACYQRALKINPNYISAHTNMGSAFQEKGQLDKALTCYQKAIQINVNFADAYYNLGTTLQKQGKVDEAIENYILASTNEPRNRKAFHNLLFVMNYSSRYDAQTIFSEHLRFAKQFVPHLLFSISPHTNERLSTRRLRIGYISPDFRRHPVAFFIEPVIIAHNREHFEVFCYSNSLQRDEVTKRIQEHADQWRNIVGMSDDQAVKLIKRDAIDILIDLTGHTANNRFFVFARKPAPIQVSWIGYLATTGLSTIDYKIVDAYTDPPGKTEQFHTEKLIRLPESFLCYLPNKDSPDVGPLPALSTGHITFGSFNNFAKVTSEVFTLWAKILHELPDSRLILKAMSFHDKTTCQYAINMFTQRGIAAERITLQSSDPYPQHLASYNFVDIGLDTFPFNGATTTCEALWMGVPVITLEGTAYHSRSGTSLLSNVGLRELVAKTSEEYVEIAVNLTRDTKRLQALREQLRGIMAHSPLTDAKQFTANLEESFRKMWDNWCKSL